jgi:hypothetical protein
LTYTDLKLMPFLTCWMATRKELEELDKTITGFNVGTNVAKFLGLPNVTL